MKRHLKPEGMAFSYIRFSTPEQRKGHSLERQTKRALAWCEKNGVTLDTSRSWHDLGRSAFLGEHRSNPDRHALAAFLKLVEEGRIPRGSYLIIESLDRLTREHVRAGLMLCLGLIEKGVKIVQLSPSEIVYDEKSDEMSLMLMIVELARGHGESKRKSDLIAPIWKKKKTEAKDKIVSDQLPAWVRRDGDKLVLIPEKAATVRRIFELTAAGYGVPRILAKFEREEVPAITKGGKWVRGYVGRILRDRRAMGEYLPRGGPGREPDGDPVPNYFPQVVSEQEFNLARAGSIQRIATRAVKTAAERGVPLGRRSKVGGVQGKGTPKKHAPQGKVNLFAGLITNARQGDSYFMTTRVQPKMKNRYHVLINYESQEGRSPCFAFQYDIFERAFLALLREVDPAEVVGEDNSGHELDAYRAELEDVESDIVTLGVKLDKKVSPTLMAAAERKDARKRELVELIRAAEQRAAAPAGAAWSEARSLLDTLDAAPDQEAARLRLRAALRRIISGIHMIVVPRGRDRIAALQVRFADDKPPRNYAILYCQPRSNGWQGGCKPAGLWACSLARPARRLDLRKPDHVEALLAELEVASLDDFRGESARAL